MPSTRPRLELPVRYRVLRHIASGGMASVYAAHDELLGRDVAVKVLSDALSADPAARERFAREARAAALVGDHPHVVGIFDIAQTDDDPPRAMIVMELLGGGSVADRLAGGPAPSHAQTLLWLGQAAGALDAAHATGLVHRDVKPANLLLDDGGSLKVADFGIATLPSQTSLTLTGQVVGTAAYLSPEQELGRPATPASDRYALALVAYELLTGCRASAQAHAGYEAPRATALVPGLPSAVDDVLARGLDRDPARRPATAADLVARLHDALGAPRPAPSPTLPMLPRRPRPAPTAATEPRFARPPTPPAAAREPAPARRSRIGALAIGAALLVVAGSAVAALLDSGGHARTAGPAPVKHATPARTSPPRATPPTPTPTPAAVQADAHARLAAGDVAGAIGLLRDVVGRCDVATTDPCAYAWFDLGHALRLAGDPAGAIPILEHRLDNPDQRETVQSELRAAQSEARDAEKADKHDGRAKGRDGKRHAD